MTQENPDLTNLEEFLIDESLPKKEVVKELRKQGINTKALFDRVQLIVREGYSTQLRLAAEQEQTSQTTAPDFLGQLAAMSRDTMLAVFERVAKGEFGPEYRTAALARCRNNDASGLTDEELRSWLEDIGDVLGEPDK